MGRILTTLAALLCLLSQLSAVSSAWARQAAPVSSKAAANAGPKVVLTDEFWAPRMRLNREVTLPHVLEQCEKTGRIANFEVAAGKRQGGMTGLYFNDSDLYKTIEGAAYILAEKPDPALEARCDEIIAIIAAAQEPDGYLYTPRRILDPKNMPPGGKERWSDMGAGHELYCVGHLYEAAVAYASATGKRTLMEVAIKNADLVASVFGPGKNPHPCGHPEVEIGLSKLYDATGNRKYLDLLEFFILTRGKAEGRPLYGEYAQDHLPVLEQTKAVGHAVRLAYLFSGVVDLGMRTGKPEYTKAAARVWDDIVASKMYITGGIGSQGNNEGFGEAFDLPNSSAYNETCASIAFFHWNQRMFLATREAKYIDVAERTLYNAMLAGWSLSGERFFYPNPLESAHGRSRSPWFDCACCPPNVVRFIASLPEQVYASFGRELYVNHLISSEGRFTVDGTDVVIKQASGLPWKGDVAVTVSPNRPIRMAVHVRIPGWATGSPVPGSLYSDSMATKPAPVVTGPDGSPVAVRDGYATIDREWKPGDTVRFTLPMDVRPIKADSRVASGRSRVAMQRGPLVYCFEAVDQKEPHVLSMVTDPGAKWEPVFAPKDLGGVVKLNTSVSLVKRDESGKPAISGTMQATAVPYYAWANRARGAMCVWVASDPEAAKPLPAPTIAHNAKASSSFGGEVAAVSDQLEPASSGDHDNPFLHWWPRKGTREWVQYEFAKPTVVQGCEVYWFDDTGRGECRLPASWRVEAMVEGAWQEVKNPSGYGVKADAYNVCTFTPVETTALRLSIQSREGWSGGVHEWRVNGGPAKPAAAAAAQPAIANGSFEQADGNAPAGWKQSIWGGKGELTHASSGRTGSRSVAIRSEAGGDLAWSVTVPVEYNSKYKLTGWIKTENVKTKNGGQGALFNIHNIQSVRTKAITGTSDWTEVSAEFETGLQDQITINCLFGGWGFATGQAWFDDVSLTLIKKGELAPPLISVDAAAIGEPISPYIYGQFIEHLGKCIYGGIWAEMLEDRKFFDAPGTGTSPWKPFGGATVSMRTKDAFVGVHTPVVTPSGKAGGLAQGHLAVRKGKSYVGSVWASSQASGATVRVSLVWGEGDANRATFVTPPLGAQFSKHEFTLTAAGDSDDARLEIESASAVAIGTASLMPSDHIRGFRADTLALLRELDSPVYRWPGGNFVSGYDWRDGVGDRDRRPPRKNPAWLGIEHNDVGIHEFMDLCDLLKTEAYIAVNAGLGGVENAAAELEYVNGGAETPMGKLRTSHGRRDPWKVKFWGVGNEMYGSWQLGNIPLAEYTKRHNTFVDAMRKVDPSITIIAVGAVGEWSRTMLAECSGHMDHISEHVYWQDGGSLLSHVQSAPRSLAEIARAHRQYREELPMLRGREIRIVQDEWNYWYGPHVFGELGTRYFMKDALGCAAALNEFGRNSDLFFMANYAQTVNVIGAIKTSRTNAAFDVTGLVLKMYRHHLGTIPCKTTSSPLVDALAAWSADRKTLTIAVVNATTQAMSVPLDLKGATLAGTGVVRSIAGDPMAFNDPDGEKPVSIRERRVEGISGTLPVEPCSVTLFTLDVR
jgi:hypothetical protein